MRIIFLQLLVRELSTIIIKDDPDIHWPAADIPKVDLPTAFDWRDHNAVTPVKNQVNIEKQTSNLLDSMTDNK